jgi:P4 family phage/plasmid primase-like protien
MNTELSANIELRDLMAGHLRRLLEPGQVTELRALEVRGRGRSHTEAGFYAYESIVTMCWDAIRLSGKSKGVYFVLNPLDPALLARCSNRVNWSDSGSLAKDENVLRRRWLPIDLDPVRLAGVSSTDEEKARALEVAHAIRNHLWQANWPSPVLADSGNGIHLLYRIELPAADGGTVERCLKSLAARFNTERVRVDDKVFNPSRIWKLYGTKSSKGDSTKDRPHRFSKILEMPDESDTAIVSQEQLELLASEVPTPEQAKPVNGALHRSKSRQGGSHGKVMDRARLYLSKMRASVEGQNGSGDLMDAARVAVYGFDLGVERGIEALSEFNARCIPPWSESEIRHKCEDADRKEFGKPRGWLLEGDSRPFNSESNGSRNAGQQADRGAAAAEELEDNGDGPQLNDSGNAQIFAKKHGANLHFCHSWRAWLFWDARRWAKDGCGHVAALTKTTQQAAYLDVSSTLLAAVHAGNSKLAGLLQARQAHLLRWGNSRGIEACMRLAESEQGIPVQPAELDRDNMLLNVMNGTLELRTGILRPHRQDDLITKLCPVEYDPSAQCPTWEHALAVWMDRNAELTKYLQTVIGYCLTGEVTEQCLWFFYGAGSNGKSTFLAIILELLGDYGIQAVAELLMAKRGDSHPTERADLYGKRFVATIETDEGKRMAESLMKQLTGGDKVRARRMRENFFEFSPTWKIFLAANHKPAIRGQDFAVWRRIKLVPFTVTISESDKDPRLLEKLKAELPGILAWAVRGCAEWQKNGLREPEEVRQATAAYQAEQDSLGRFISEICFVHPETRVLAIKLLEAYQRYSGDRSITPQTFKIRMEAKGYSTIAGHANRRFYVGLGLPEDESG